jgi:hypothetical protein
MNMRDGIEVKKFLQDMIVKYNPVRIETTSLDMPKLNKWHSFLGFKCEGTKRKYFAGKDYKMWSIVNGC